MAEPTKTENGEQRPSRGGFRPRRGRPGPESDQHQDGQQQSGQRASGHQEPPARIIPLASSSAGLSASAAYVAAGLLDA